MSKALIVTGGYPSVSQTFVLREIASMMQAGWDVHVLSPLSGNDADWAQAAQFGLTSENVTFLNWRRVMPSMAKFSSDRKNLLRAADIGAYGRTLGARRVGFFRRVFRLCREQKIGLIHCHFVQWAAEVGCGIANGLGLAMTVEVHDSHLPHYPSSVLRRVQNAASGLACVSHGWMELWEQRTGSSKGLAYVPNGIEVGEFERPEKLLPNRRPVIISVSSCVRHKRPDDLVRAIALLKKRNVDADCVIVGGGEYISVLENLVHDLSVGDRVRLTGALPHVRVRELMTESDIFALCSERESFGIVTVEAMASRLPTVVSKTIGARDIVEDGKTGFTFEIGDVNGLAQHLETLLRDPARRHRLGRAGRQRASECFSWKRHMQLIEATWEYSLRKSKGNGPAYART